MKRWFIDIKIMKASWFMYRVKNNLWIDTSKREIIDAKPMKNCLYSRHSSIVPFPELWNMRNLFRRRPLFTFSRLGWKVPLVALWYTTIYLFICIYIYFLVYIYIYIYIYMNMYIYIIYTYKYTYTYIHIIYTYKYTYTYIFVNAPTRII